MRGYLSIYYRLKNQLKYEETIREKEKKRMYAAEIERLEKGKVSY